MKLEDFRKLIGGFVTSLNRDSTQYKIAKRYGFILEVEKPVVFYFEEIMKQVNQPASSNNIIITEKHYEG